ncbi:MAG: DNA cytosine methyltransferase [Lachnospiraceae bacterium]|nr:DNA cytosine methyltransferase [Lachnospiraceae bacterium]
MKTVDLFCGAGGFSKGFEMAGFETALALDRWEQAIETFNHNRAEKVAVSMDINEYSNRMIADLAKRQEITGIIGGPPCQGYSMVGTRNAKDVRNSLYLQYVRFVEQIRPAFFILENVKGLLTLKKGFFRNDIIRRFTGLSYNVNYKVLTASEFGVPQNRERVFFVGLRKDIFGDSFFEFPEPDREHIISTKMAISDLPSLDAGDDPTKYTHEPMNDFQRRMRGNCQKITNNEPTKHSKRTVEVISNVPDGKCIKDVSTELFKVRNFNAAFRRMNSALPSRTVDCGHRNYFHYEENRVPTARESARIQSFPDSYFFTGNKGDQYTQIGNAVPPLLGYALAVQVRKMLEDAGIGDRQ